MPYQFRLKTII